MTDSLSRIYASVQAARGLAPAQSRTARLLGEGMVKIAKKLAEEAVEIGLEAVCGERDAVVLESADLLYNLCVLWVVCGVTPDEVNLEIKRREQIYGIAEKIPKRDAPGNKALLKEQFPQAV